MSKSIKILITLLMVQCNYVYATMNMTAALCVFEDVQEGIRANIYQTGHLLSINDNINLIEAAVQKFNHEFSGTEVQNNLNYSSNFTVNSDRFLSLYDEATELFGNYPLRKSLEKASHPVYDFKNCFIQVVLFNNHILSKKNDRKIIYRQFVRKIEQGIELFPINRFIQRYLSQPHCAQ